MAWGGRGGGGGGGGFCRRRFRFGCQKLNIPQRDRIITVLQRPVQFSFKIAAIHRVGKKYNCFK
jgi:hypothetical protein